MTTTSNKTTFKDQLAAAALPVKVPHVIGGERRFEGAAFTRVNPSHPEQGVSEAAAASKELVVEAVEVSRAAQLKWSRIPVAERVAKVRKGIEYVSANIDQWAVRAALETGKPEADARVEALETLQFLKIYPDYAEEEGYFDDPRLKSGADQYTAAPVRNDSVLRPYGVFGVITPFNYPAALASGPAIAAVLAGNGVVIKTSSMAPWTGLAVYEMFEAMDLPVGLVNVIHGGGKELVSSGVDGLAFTGSAETGSTIARALAEGPYPKPFIAELGGKNPVIVTKSADLEQAAEAIVYSGFHLSGQKCSALSRVLVDEKVHDQLVTLVERRINTYELGAPEDGEVIGPVISPEAVERYEQIRKTADQDGLRHVEATNNQSDGYFVAPMMVSGVPADHSLARDEHFLPVITISPVDSFETALNEANASEYGLTAGIFTASNEEAREFLHRIEAGCVNVNIPGHAVTGWWPGPQTFGGWKGSGSTGVHGFGKWYLHQFTRQQARKVPQELAELLVEVV